MPVERRLRQGFHRNADALEPDVEGFLSTVLLRERRRRLVRRRMVASIAVAAMLALAVLGPRVVDAMRNSRPEIPRISPAPGPQGLTGTFQGRLRLGLAAVRVDRMAGQWAIAMNPDGTMTVHAPSAFVGVLGGYRFQPQGSGFRTNLFADDVCRRFPWGRYTWSRSGDELTFTVAHDPCDARLALLTSEATYQPSPLDGEWHMRYSCEQSVRTFQRNVLLDSSQSVLSDGRSGAALSKVWSRDFAWGPSAQTANSLTPKALCQGAPDREHVMKIRGDYITEDPRTIALVGTITFLNDHTITVSDAWGNIDTIDTFVFRLRGDRLTLTQTGVHDSWQGTWLEEAPWTRVS